MASPVPVDVAEAGREPMTSALAFPMVGTASYQQLPNPLVGALQLLPEVDGLNETRLVEFCGQVFKLIDLPGASSDLVLRLVFPYCRGLLAELLARATSRGMTLDAFHAEALDVFIPGRLREQLRQQLFYRVQAPCEELALFVGRIREAAKVLRIPISEQEVVQVILQGVTPQERSRLVFAGRPVSFSDLERMCVMSRNIQAIDASRSPPAARESEGVVRRPPHSPFILLESESEKILIFETGDARPLSVP